MTTAELNAAPQAHEGAHGYLPASQVMHWLTVAFVALLVTSGVTMKQIGDGPVADQLYTIHKSAGALALVLIVGRLGFRLGAMLTGRWRRSAGAHAIHAVLYGVLILAPLLGWAGVSDFGARGLLFGLELPAIWREGAGYADAFFAAHAYLAFGLLALVSLHIGIAMDHHVKRGSSGEMPDS